MKNDRNTFSTLDNDDYISNFYDKLNNVTIQVATLGIVPILLIGSYFYFRTGFIMFGVIEILISAFILIIASIHKISKQHKQSVILITLYYTSIFVLLTTGNSGAGISSLIMVIMLFSIVSRKSKNYTLFYINLMTSSIITILLFLGVFSNLAIASLKDSWPFLYIILNAYSLVFIFVFGNYKNQFQKTQLLLKTSIESFNDLIVLSVDQNYCYLYFNKAHKDTMKKLYNVEIEIGKSILDYISDIDDRNGSKKNYDLALLGTYHSTIEDIKGDHQRINFEASYSPIYDDESEIVGVALFARDITDRMKHERALKYEKELAQKYLNLAGSIIIVLDKEATVTLINKKGCEIIGLSEKEILGKNWFDNFIPNEIVEDVKKVFENVFLNNSQISKQHENVLVTSNLENRLISWENCILYNENGEITGVISSGKDITEFKKKSDMLTHISYHDSLTKLHNRRFLFEEIEKYWRQCIREQKSISFIMIDIDDFKLYNDSFGHIEGDKALVKLANVFNESMARPLDIVGRFGGEEFLVVLPNTPLEGAYDVSENIRKKIVELEIVHSENSNSELLSISLGVTSLIPNQEDTIEHAINDADIALFYAKENGKNRTEVYSKDLELKCNYKYK